MNSKQIAEKILELDEGVPIHYWGFVTSLPRNEVVDLAKAHLEALVLLKTVSKLLNGIQTELNASVYTVTDDEFETTYFCRDMIDDFLKLHDDKETGE